MALPFLQAPGSRLFPLPPLVSHRTTTVPFPSKPEEGGKPGGLWKEPRLSPPTVSHPPPPVGGRPRVALDLMCQKHLPGPFSIICCGDGLPFRSQVRRPLDRRRSHFLGSLPSPHGGADGRNNEARDDGRGHYMVGCLSAGEGCAPGELRGGPGEAEWSPLVVHKEPSGSPKAALILDGEPSVRAAEVQ